MAAGHISIDNGCIAAGSALTVRQFYRLLIIMTEKTETNIRKI